MALSFNSFSTQSKVSPFSKKEGDKLKWASACAHAADCQNQSSISQANRQSNTALTFGGLTNHIKQKDRWFSTKTMYHLLGIPYSTRDKQGTVSQPVVPQAAYSTKYLGKVPSLMALEKNLPEAERCTPHQWLKRIDDFAAFLRPFNRSFTEDVLTEALSKEPTDKQWTPMTAKFIDKGNYGTLYRITYKGKDFGLKVFHDPANGILSSGGISLNGPVAESTSNLNLSRYGENHIPLFDLANPKSGWILREFIDPQKDYTHRTGPNRKPLPFVSSDASASEQYVNNMLVDLGGAKPVYLSTQSTRFWKNSKRFKRRKTLPIWKKPSVPFPSYPGQ
jgi:hypothetical protein